MNRPDPPSIRFHDDPDLFREALNFTAAETAFSPRLIEKDYFCTVLLDYLAGAHLGLVFKGGTCLAKVHADFYRLSEDLDFVIDVPASSTRSQRSRLASGMKDSVAHLPERLPGFRLVDPFQGANSSTQYIATIAYRSLLRNQEEIIKIEVGLREPLLTQMVEATARTLVLDPVSGKPLVPAVQVRCLSKQEALAEKFRAALSRREVAIRDFFDIDYAVRRMGLHPTNADFIDLVQRKLNIPGNDPVNVGTQRLAELRRQTEAQLKPVLRERDYAEFDLYRAFSTVVHMAAAVG